jgi:hypothetical protein
MRTLRHVATGALVGLVVGGGFAPRAAAQENSPTLPQPAQASVLKIEPIQSGFVVAPDVRFTEMNGDFANLVGVYGGWMNDRTLVIGAGGYWLTNRADDFKMAYGGGVIGWLVHGDRRIGFGARALVGGGNATLSSTLGEVMGDLHHDPVPHTVDVARFGSSRGIHGPGRPLPSDTRVVVDADYFVAEPQANVFWTVTPWLQVNAGVGYRLIAGAGNLNDDLRGLSGSLAIQFGGQ